MSDNPSNSNSDYSENIDDDMSEGSINSVPDEGQAFEDSYDPAQPTLRKHPIFKCSEDDFMKPLLEALEKVFENPLEFANVKQLQGSWADILRNYVFSNKSYEDLHTEFAQLDISFNTPCGKLIPMGGIYFRCLDCDNYKDSTKTMYALQCPECFEKSNHVGHRVLIKKKDNPSSVTCDCGDTYAWKENGACCAHKPKEVNVDDVIQQLPSEIVERAVQACKKTFYFIISVNELALKTNVPKLNYGLKGFMETVLNETLTFFVNLYDKVHEACIAILGLIFKANCNYNNQQSTMWHDCKNFSGLEDPELYDPDTAKDCNCSIVALLLRNSYQLQPYIQIQLHKILIECAKERSFKSFLMKQFTQNVRSLYPKSFKSQGGSEDNSNSKLLNMKVQLYGTEELCKEAVQDGHWSNFLMEMASSLEKAESVSYELYYVLSDIRSSLIYFLRKNCPTSKRMIEANLIEKIMTNLANFQMKFLYKNQFNIHIQDHQVSYQSLNCGLMTEKVMNQILEQCFRVIFDYPDVENKEELIKKQVVFWKQCFDQAKTVIDEQKKAGMMTFTLGLERLLGFILRAYNPNMSPEGHVNFLENYMGVQNVPEFVLEIGQGMVQSLGIIRFLHLVHNFEQGSIWNVYYFFNNSLFENDIVNIQMMCSLSDPQDIFEMLVENYFSYDKEMKFFFEAPGALENDERFSRKKMAIEDFLNLLIYLMTDEICLLNLEVYKDAHSFSTHQIPTERQKIIHEKIIINILLGYYWTDVPQLKKCLKLILKEIPSVDSILQKVAIIDTKNKKIRIKDEYVNNYDPYMFYRVPHLQRDIAQNVASKMKKDENFDLISGINYSNLPKNLIKIQHNLYLSALPKFLQNYLLNHNKVTSIFVRPILKLISQNLMVIKNCKDTETRSDLLKIAKESYFNNEVTQILQTLSKSYEFNDCQACIRKIQKLMTELESNVNESQLQEEEEEKLDQAIKKQIDEVVASQKQSETSFEAKKKAALLKQQQLQQQMKSMQQKFSESNQTAVTKAEENKAVDEERICQYCLEKIDTSGQDYGLPIFVTLTNNFYETTASKDFTFEKIVNPQNLETPWWPVISTCGHYFHSNCFQSHFAKTKAPNDVLKKLFANQHESYCSLCKTLCNCFLPVNSNNNELTNLNVSSGGVQQATGGINGGTIKKPAILEERLSMLIESLRNRLRTDVGQQGAAANMSGMANNFKPGKPIDLDVFYNKTYHFLVKSLQQAESSTRVSKNFEFYCEFFRRYIQYIIASSKDLKYQPGLFSQIFTSDQLSKKNVSISQKVKILCDFNPDDLAINHSLDFLMHGISDQEGIESFNNELLKDLISFRLIQYVLAYKKNLQENLPENEVVHMKNLKTFFKSEQVQAEFLQAFLPSFKTVFASCAFNQMTLNQETKFSREFFSTLIQEDTITSTNQMDILLQLINSETNWETFMADCFDKISKGPIVIISNLNSLLREEKDELKEGQQLVPMTVSYKPKMIQLPQTYDEFNTIYFKKKCKYCNQFCQHLSSVICLICGEVFCQAYCSINKKAYGNLNRHAKEYHLGQAVYQEIQQLNQTVISAPSNAIVNAKNIYRDQFGQSIQFLINEHSTNLYSLQFSDFQLNEEIFARTKAIVQHHQYAQQAFSTARTQGRLYNLSTL